MAGVREVQDLGNGFVARLSKNTKGEYVGATIEHPRPGGGLCEGHVIWEYGYGPKEVWGLVSLDPLELGPKEPGQAYSVLCHCGAHGYIRGGRWEPC